MKVDRDLAKEWEFCIRDAIVNNSEIEADEGESILFSDVDDVEVFNGKGVTVKLNDGSRVNIKVQAYRKENEQMSGWDYKTLRDGVEHAVGNLQRDFLQSYGIEDITQIDTDLGEELERAIYRIADCIQRQLVLERNPISTHYCEKDDITFIMQDKYDDNGTLIEKKCVGWYFGKPNKVNTDEYVGKLVADYT